MEPINLFDYEALAQQRLEPAVWDYYQGGSGDEVTLRENRAAFERILLRPRVLVDVSAIDMRTTVLQTPVRMPILIAPTAAHSLAHPQGELATARAAGRAGTVMIVSTTASYSIEEVAAVAGGELWLQLYSHHSRETTGQLVRRAESAGYRAIVLTVDTPFLGRRERDIRNHFLIGKRVRLPTSLPMRQSRQPGGTWSTPGRPSTGSNPSRSCRSCSRGSCAGTTHRWRRNGA